MDSNRWVDQYRSEYPKFIRLTKEFQGLLVKLLKNAEIKCVVDGRTKDIDSFAGKISRPGKNYTNPLQDVSDLSGLRIIVDSLTDVDRVAEIIRKEFEVDKKRSVNKADSLDLDRFGYLSQHFVVSVSKTRKGLPEWAGLGGLFAEIQVRTALQHTWSTLQHPLAYKSAIEIPRPLRRRLFRLSALFELADAELDQVSKEAAQIKEGYAARIQQFPGAVPIDLDSLRAYLETSDEFEYWNRFVNSIPNTKTEAGLWGSRDVSMPLACGLQSVADYNKLLKKSHGWGEKYLTEMWLVVRNSPEAHISVSKNGILLYLLIANYPDVLTAEILQAKYGFGNPKPGVQLAKKINPRFIQGG